jgi:hypothetical protein
MEDSSMTKLTHITAIFSVSIVFVVAPAIGSATPLILNGGFESGFTSWVRANQLGSEGTFSLQSGTVSPVNGNTVPSPPGSLNAAMTDSFGPEVTCFIRISLCLPRVRFSVSVCSSATVRTALPHLATLDFSTPTLNQQARVDILRAGTDPFTAAATDILLNLYRTQVGDPLVSGYNTLNFDLTSLFSANVGQTLRLRFAETDNLSAFQFGVDNVQLETATTAPEPQSILLLGTGVLALLAIRRRI